ncbi:tetratricopeptide repeat protein [Fervidibacillus halotolerans]|uniref:Tetratricopeptide repeat protein n=1 Tax=Fervidibacillus halotolerans TaxID=2980027 RepID=A0A9E8RYF2_9BACI|nr:tetratricopeptide repeat protein [Fervidibacillus halotolerans]WAA13755.1 tetratricopeptide repeat protein [Fervidibacillus halotolerans]
MNRIQEILHALENGNLQKAMKLKDDILKNGDEREIYVLAEQLKNLGFLEEVIPLYKKLLERYPNEGELLVDLAEVYIQLDEGEKALLTLEKIKKDDPVYVESLLLSADLYENEGLYEVCEQKLREAEKILPDEPLIQFAMGEFFSSIGKFAEAVYKYEKVLEKTDTIDGVNIHARLAEIYSTAGEFEKALPFYEKALEDKITVDMLFGYGFTLFQSGQYEGAIEKLKEVKTLDPDYESAYFPLSEAYEKIGDYKSALEVAKEGININPFQKELVYFAGNLCVKLGLLNEAEDYFQKSLELDPDYVEAMLAFNRLLFQQGRYQEANERMEPLINGGEEDPDLLWDYAVSCQHEEKYSEALNAYNKAYKYLKENEEFLQNYGFFLLEEGNKGDAIEVFKQLLQIDPTNVEYIDVLERLEVNR